MTSSPHNPPEPTTPRRSTRLAAKGSPASPPSPRKRAAKSRSPAKTPRVLHDYLPPSKSAKGADSADKRFVTPPPQVRTRAVSRNECARSHARSHSSLACPPTPAHSAASASHRRARQTNSARCSSRRSSPGAGCAARSLRCWRMAPLHSRPCLTVFWYRSPYETSVLEPREWVRQRRVSHATAWFDTNSTPGPFFVLEARLSREQRSRSCV